MNAMSEQTVFDETAVNTQHFPNAPQAFFHAWKHGVQLAGNDLFVNAAFEKGYQALKKTTNDFTTVTTASVEAAVVAVPIAFIVFRSILGFTPPEWAYVTTERTSVRIDQGAARTIDRNIRLRPLTSRSLGGQR